MEDDRRGIIDQDFREEMIKGITEIKTNTANMKEDITGQGHSLYGKDGRGGLVRDFETLKQSQSRWNKGVALLQGLVMAGIAYIGLLKE